MYPLTAPGSPLSQRRAKSSSVIIVDLGSSQQILAPEVDLSARCLISTKLEQASWQGKLDSVNSISTACPAAASIFQKQFIP